MTRAQRDALCNVAWNLGRLYTLLEYPESPRWWAVVTDLIDALNEFKDNCDDPTK